VKFVVGGGTGRKEKGGKAHKISKKKPTRNAECDSRK